MVTPVGSIVPGSPPRASEVDQSRTSRSVSEVRRTVAQRDVTGAEATRLLNLAQQAEQSADRGKSPEASRIAREALQQARESSGYGIPSPNDSEDTPRPELTNDNGRPEDAQGTSGVGNEAQNLGPGDKRNYKDNSDDSGVSFQYAQPLSRAQAPLAVRQHELSHIRRETSDAIIEGRRVQASVTISRSIDPETGEVIVEGGRARVVEFPEVKMPIEVSISVEREEGSDAGQSRQPQTSDSSSPQTTGQQLDLRA